MCERDVDIDIDIDIHTDTDTDMIIDMQHGYQTQTPGRETRHIGAASRALAPAVPAVAFCLDVARPAPFPALCACEDVYMCVCVCARARVCVCVCVRACARARDLIFMTFTRCNSWALSSAAWSAFCHCSSRSCGLDWLRFV